MDKYFVSFTLYVLNKPQEYQNSMSAILYSEYFLIKKNCEPTMLSFEFKNNGGNRLLGLPLSPNF
jgi:hypothetical protein